jgi:hypothetical protein
VRSHDVHVLSSCNPGSYGLRVTTPKSTLQARSCRSCRPQRHSGPSLHSVRCCSRITCHSRGLRHRIETEGHHVRSLVCVTFQARLDMFSDTRSHESVAWPTRGNSQERRRGWMQHNLNQVPLARRRPPVRRRATLPVTEFREACFHPVAANILF